MLLYKFCLEKLPDTIWDLFKNVEFWEFPSNPVVSTLSFYHGGSGFYSWSGNQDSASDIMWQKNNNNNNKIIKKIEMQNVKSQLGIKICILTVSLGDLYVN